MNMPATRDCTLKSLKSNNTTQIKVSWDFTFTHVQSNVRAS